MHGGADRGRGELEPVRRARRRCSLLRPVAPRSAPRSAAPSATVSRPWRWRYAADASTTSATAIASTTAKPTIITVAWPRSSRVRSRRRTGPPGTGRSARCGSRRGRSSARLPPSALGISGRSTREWTTTVITEVPLWQSSGYGVQVTRTSSGASLDALVGQRLPGRGLGAGRPVGVGGGQRVGPPGRAGGGADPERAALHLEDRQHDPQHRHQQQDAEPGQLDQRAARARRGRRPSRWLLLDRVAGDLELDRRAADARAPARRRARSPRRRARRRRRPACADVLREAAGDRAVDLAAGARRAVGRSAVERWRRTARPRTPRRPGCCGRSSTSATWRMPRKSGHEHDQHQHEVHDRGPALARVPAQCAAHRSVVTRVERVAQHRGRAGPWPRPRSPSTSPAVITVISTQPGTSPRSSRLAAAGEQRGQ